MSVGGDIRLEKIQYVGKVYNIFPTAGIPAPVKPLLNHLLARHMPFGGREVELGQLYAFVSQSSSGYVFVTAQSGFGKTALLANWVKALSLNDQDVCYHFISRLDRVADEESLLVNLCQQLIAFHGLSGEPPTRIAEMRSLYLTLLETPPPEGRKLIAVLDGLDEALNWTPGPDLFPRSLPESIFVVFSAREVSNWDWIAKLGLSRSVVDTLRLEMLGTAEIAHLLSLGSGTVSLQANNTKFVEVLHKVSQGDPFYLHFLLEDMENGHINEKNINQQPVGLNDYLTEWWNQLNEDVDINRQEAYDLLGILTIAKGPLLTGELAGISPVLRRGALLKKELGSKLRRYLAGDSLEGYVLCHPRFGDYLQTIFFPDELQNYREELLSYCSRWREHKSKYALSFYPAHLFELGRARELYALIDKAWMDAQFENTYSYMVFSSHIELAITLAEAETPPNFVQIARNSLIYSTIGSLANNIPVFVLKVLTEVGQWEEAQGYTALMPEAVERCQAFGQIGIILMQQGKTAEARASFEKAVRAAESIDDQASSALLLAGVVKALTEAGEKERAEEIANQAMELLLADPGTHSSLLMGVASAFAQAGLEDFCFTAMNESKESRGRIAIVVELLAAYVKGGYVEKALQFADTIDYGGNPVPKCLVQVGLAHALSEVGKMAQAAEIVDRLPSLIEPIADQIIKPLLLTQIARAFAWIGKETRATEIVNQAIELSEMITADFEKPWVLASATKSLAQIGHVKRALLLADSIVGLELEPNPSHLRAKGEALTEVAKALTIVGDDEQALALSTTAESLKQARFASGTHPVEYILPDETIWSLHEEPPVVVDIVKIMVEAGRMEKAKAVVREISDSSTRYAALLEIARGETYNSHTEEALAIIEGINDSSDKARAQAIIAEILLDAGDSAQAKVVIERAIAQARMISDPWSETEAIRDLIRVLAQAGQKEAALKVAETITKNRAWTLVTIAQSLAEQGNALSVTALVEQAISLANQTKDWIATAVWLRQQHFSIQLSSLLKQSLLLKIAVVLSQIDQRARAGEIVDQVVATFAAQEPEIREEIVAEGASSLARLNQAKHALALTNTMCSSWYGIPVLAEVINAFLREKDTEAGEQTLAHARNAIQSLEEGWEKEPIITEFITILAQGGQVKRALTVFEDVDTLIRQISGDACAEIIQVLARAGETTEAREIARAAIAEAEEDEDWSVMVSNLTTLVSVLTSPDMDDLISTGINRALEAMEKIEDLEQRSSAKANIAKALAQVGEVDHALVIAESITYKYGATSKGSALEAVAEAFMKAEQRERAVDIMHRTTEIAEEIEDPEDKISLLITAITLYTKLEANQQAISTLIKAFSRAHSSSRSDVFKILEAGCSLLAAVDGVHMLSSLHHALQETDNWWSKQFSSEDTMSSRPFYTVRMTRSFFE